MIILRQIACAALLLASISVFAGETLYVIAPDQKNAQLLTVEVGTSDDGVAANLVEPLPLSFRPSSIAAHKDNRRFIVSSAQSGGDGVLAAEVEILETGKLQVTNSFSLRNPTGYTSIDRSGRYLLSTNYRTGSIDVYRIDQSGEIGSQICSRQAPRSYAHSILTTRDNRFAYVPCVKENNALYQFTFDEKSGQLSPLDPFDASPPAMSGPRHVAYHPTLPVAYFSNEQQLGVSVYEIGNDGQLAARQHAVSMPRRSPYVPGQRGMHASDLVVTGDGKLLLLAVRDFVADQDSVFTFQVETDGRLKQLHRAPVGDIPWKLELSPDSGYLFVSESSDRCLSIFTIDSEGKLSLAARIDWGAAVRDMVVVPSPIS